VPIEEEIEEVGIKENEVEENESSTMSTN